MEFFKNIVNWLSTPAISFPLSIVVFYLAMKWKWLWTKAGGMLMLILTTIFLVVGMFDPNFRLVVAKPDNVPIVMMIYLVGFFWWLSMHKAYKNDALMEQGEPTFEKTEAEDRIFTWPDLVFSEFICMVVLTVGMVIWSIALQAPLEEPANSSVAPNPSKAPWYFLGLQEMLVYFDPWMAGVVLPSLIIVGLMAIPYIDKNPKGNGYYSYKEREPEILLFMFGFIILWVELIIIGTFMRGPNWNFFGPFEYWDHSKIEPLVNVNLSEIIWIKILGTGLPSHWLLRESFGIAFMVFYLFILPVLMTKMKYFKHFYTKMGATRYYVGMSLFLIMMLMPIKMMLRWLFELKYIVQIQEFFFNI